MPRTPERPWHSVPNWPAHLTGDEMVATMDKVGVADAIYISPFSMYQYDPPARPFRDRNDLAVDRPLPRK
jgi:hypothetical protein